MFDKMVLGFVISLVLTLIFLPMLIAFLHKINYEQSVSEYALEEYKNKKKTPIMGGIGFVLIPILVTIVLNINCLKNMDCILVFLAFIGYGLIGFIDDFIIAIKHDNGGLKASHKFLMQLILAVVFYFLYQSHVSVEITIPFFKTVIPLGILYMPLVLFMFTGASNAVNLTDGMDGLAAGCSFLSLSPFVLFAIQQQEMDIALFIVCLMGSLLGYLKYNMHPADIFMGDTGSLALGGVLAALALVLKQEIALVVIGGVFVFETLCVIIQISSVKIRHKRVFRYTPIHYSFVIGGMKEEKVVLMFWMMALLCAILGFFIGVI